METQSVYVTCRGQVATQQFGGELAKHRLLRLSGPQARPSSVRGQGRGAAGVEAERERRTWLPGPREPKRWCKPTSPLPPSSPRFGALYSRCGSLPRGFAPPPRSSSLLVSVCALDSHATRSQLPSNLAGAKLTPKCRGEMGRDLCARRNPPFRSSLSSAERREPPAVTPPRRADGASEVSGRRISHLFDRSIPIRSGFPPPPDGASALARLPGLPPRGQGSPAPPRAT